MRFGLGLPPSTGMREALQWLSLARLGVLYIVLIAVVLLQVFRKDAFSGSYITASYSLLAVGFAFNLLFATFVDWIPLQGIVAGIHIIFDVSLTSSWIFLTSGGDNLFALFYLVQILLVSLILYQKGAWFATASSSVAFAIVMTLHPTVYPGAFTNWMMFSGIFLVVGVVGGYLSEELLRTTESLKEKSRKIEKLTALHESLIANMPTGLLTVDREMRINFINPAGEHILGRNSREIVGRLLAEVEPGLMPFFSKIETERVPDEGELDIDAEVRVESSLSATGSDHSRSFFVQARSDKGQARLQQRVEFGEGIHRRSLRGDVAKLDPEAGMGRLLDEEASGARVLLFQDVTKLLHLEERLRQNEKLAAVGQLAAGIAHEIRNPLASMSASIEMLKEGMPHEKADSENQKLMDIAIREIDRLNRLVSEFLDFVKPEKFIPKPVDLRVLISEVVAAISRNKDLRRLTFKEEYSEGVIASGSENKLKQVVWNLLTNAVQAMTSSGVITVGCAKAPLGRVKFWIEDQGQGMSDDVQAHLYEPFFTTKDKGTGLGLATAYKIIESHHGEMRVSSKVHIGTRFDVFLSGGE